ncbi:MAG: magnesium transporter CorA family protein [Patescibacteria group bacterium]|nr:magnesium transporter CorA family protein [Patescibacteria group bacterium]
MKSIKTDNYAWLYFENPDKDDLEALQKIFQLHPVVLGEFNSPTYRPKVARYNNYIFMVLHFPVFNEEEKVTEMGEVDIIINNEYLVTSCNKHNNVLYQYFQEKNKSQGSPAGRMPKNPYLLLFKIIDKLTNACFPMLDHISDHLDEIEAGIFNGSGQSLVKEISVIKRDILNFRRVIQPQRSIINSLGQSRVFVDRDDYEIQINDIIGTHIRVWNVLENHKETIDSLEATNDSLFSYKLNQTIKMLTIFSVVMLPASLIAGLFGMNVTIPMKDFWSITALVGSLMLAFLSIMKIKKWF